MTFTLEARARVPLIGIALARQHRTARGNVAWSVPTFTGHNWATLCFIEGRGVEHGATVPNLPMCVHRPRCSMCRISSARCGLNVKGLHTESHDCLLCSTWSSEGCSCPTLKQMHHQRVARAMQALDAFRDRIMHVLVGRLRRVAEPCRGGRARSASSAQFDRRRHHDVRTRRWCR